MLFVRTAATCSGVRLVNRRWSSCVADLRRFRNANTCAGGVVPRLRRELCRRAALDRMDASDSSDDDDDCEEEEDVEESLEEEEDFEVFAFSSSSDVTSGKESTKALALRLSSVCFRTS